MARYSLKIVSLVVVLGIAASCSKEIDPKLIGTWERADVPADHGLISHFERKADGVVKMITFPREVPKNTYLAIGEWWVEGDLLFEKYQGDDFQYEFRYEVKSPDSLLLLPQNNPFTYLGYEADTAHYLVRVNIAP